MTAPLEFRYLNYDDFDINGIKISANAPNMNAFSERFIGSVRREAFDWFILFNETQIKNILTEYIGYIMKNDHIRELLRKYQKDTSRKNKEILSLTQYFPVCIIITKGSRLKLS